MWDKSLPTGQDLVKFSAQNIRDMKADIEAAFNVEHHFSAGDYTGTHKIPYGSTPPVTDLLDGRIFVSTSQGLLRCNGTSWSNIATNFPTGTRMYFKNSVAPLGWVQVTDFNDYILSSNGNSNPGGSYGGTWGYSYAGTIESEGFPHTHTVAGTTGANHQFHNWDGGGTDQTASQDSHTHSFSVDTDNQTYIHSHIFTLDIPNTWRPKYMDVILCSKS